MKSRKGFTLIELALTLALIGIVVSLIYSLISFTQNNFNNQNEKSENISNARYAMDYLTREIRRGESISIKDDNLIIDGSTYKIENQELFKKGESIITGIDELIVKKIDNKIDIKIIIHDKNKKSHEITSIIYQR